MPRPRTFDRDETVQKAMDAFWQNGYEATSIHDLVEVTGVARGSLYHEFRSKAGLFAAAMERYAELAPATRMLGSADTGPPRETIERFFSDIVEFVTSDTGRRGCLFTNTAVEFSARDGGMRSRIAARLGVLEDALCHLIERGQAIGEITSPREPRNLACHFLACAQGLHVMAKANANRETLQAITDTALSTLD
jgi:TetR/AcrR family transcriptional repressor of nem operon